MAPESPDPVPGIRVTVTDLDSGESETAVISDSYVLTCAGSCYLAHTQSYANGTVVLTVKGRRRS